MTLSRHQSWRRALSPERLAEQRANDRAYQDARKEIAAAYRLANKDRKATYDRTRLAENRAYRANDPWKKARESMNHARSRARKFGVVDGGLTKEVFGRLILLPCAYCGAAPSRGVDHVVSMCNGGPNTLDNLVPCCWPCNDAKGAA